MNGHRRSHLWLGALATAALLGSAGSAAAQSPAPTSGGTINYVTFAEPATLSPRMLPEGIAFQVGELVNRGLSERDNHGNIYPELAEKIPDPADGDVSEDLLTVTWKLKPDLKWSDGTPLTSDDLKYTWEVCGNPTTACAKSEGLLDVTSVDTPDEQTIVLHYSKPYFDYKLQFQNGILPRTCADCGDPAAIRNWQYNETVNPNLGPFSITEWAHGDHITLAKNPNFYLAAEGKPYLDGVNVLLRDTIETFRQLILTGEAHVSPWLTQPAPLAVQDLVDQGFQVGSGSSPYFNRFQLNLRDPNDLTQPHPILGDPLVREAIIRGTNTANVIFNWNIPGVFEAQQNPNRFSMHGAEYAGCDIQPVPYDLEAAKALLDQAGWTDSDGDGVRDKDGTKMSLRVATYTGFGQEDNVIVWIDELKNLGIEGIADPIEVTTFYSSWADNSPVFRGDFDLLYYDYAKDFGGAQNEAETLYHSDAIPSETNAAGHNMNGLSDPQIDQWVEEAGASLDPTVRADRYCSILKRVGQELWADHWNGIIPNFQMASPRLQGWTDGELYVWFGSDSENWYLEP